MSKCYAVQHSDQMVCERCYQSWDVNDVCEPNCKSDVVHKFARLVDALEQGFPLLSDEGLDEVEHHCEWVIQRERKRVHSILAAHRKGGD